jgi:hypothetical protein
VETGAVDSAVLRPYRLAPLFVPHYGLKSAIAQKINALASRAVAQARDVFDLYVLGSQCNDSDVPINGIAEGVLEKARERALEMDFSLFKGAVVSYLAVEDQPVYSKQEAWEDMRLKAAQLIEQAGV